MAKRLSLSFVVFLVSILLLTDSVQKKKNQGSLKVPAAVPKHRTAAAGKGKKPPGASKAQQQAAEIIAAKKKMEAAVSADKIAALQERPAEQLLTMKGMESILLDAQSVLSQLVDNLFYDKKVLECLAPYICNLIGLEQYYDPWTQKCKALSNYEIAMRKPKPFFAELVAACKEQPNVMFADYARKKGIKRTGGGGFGGEGGFGGGGGGGGGGDLEERNPNIEPRSAFLLCHFNV